MTGPQRKCGQLSIALAYRSLPALASTDALDCNPRYEPAERSRRGRGLGGSGGVVGLLGREQAEYARQPQP